MWPSRLLPPLKGTMGTRHLQKICTMALTCSVLLRHQQRMGAGAGRGGGRWGEVRRVRTLLYDAVCRVTVFSVYMHSTVGLFCFKSCPLDHFLLD